LTQFVMHAPLLAPHSTAHERMAVHAEFVEQARSALQQPLPVREPVPVSMQGSHACAEAPTIEPAVPHEPVVVTMVPVVPESSEFCPPGDPAPPKDAGAEHVASLLPWQSATMGGSDAVLSEQAIATGTHAIDAHGIIGWRRFITPIGGPESRPLSRKGLQTVRRRRSRETSGAPNAPAR